MATGHGPPRPHVVIVDAIFFETVSVLRAGRLDAGAQGRARVRPQERRSGLFAVLTLATQAVLHLTLAPGADWSAALTLIILTALSYGPLAVALGWLLRLTGPRRPTPRGALA